ncbi:MAG: DHH family phosphoesterase, partial [Candidatus Diapherotrites archaeon]|nr:DHH family phosphoesterase [Candidatus Diapherotrites archaeon]
MAGDFAKLMLRAETLADEMRKTEDFVVVGHIDVDGITSTAITVRALQRLGKKVKYINLKQLYSEDFKKIEGMGKNILFVDFGSGQL